MRGWEQTDKSKGYECNSNEIIHGRNLPRVADDFQLDKWHRQNFELEGLWSYRRLLSKYFALVKSCR